MLHLNKYKTYVIKDIRSFYVKGKGRVPSAASGPMASGPSEELRTAFG